MPLVLQRIRKNLLTLPRQRFVILSLLVLVLTQKLVATTPYYFKHYSVENGLSNNCVTSILQDRTGFLWIGTKDGLNRFDGYSFKKFRKVSNKPGAIGSNYIHVLHEDRQGTLWIGTENGLYQYTPATETFCLIDATAGNYVDELKEDLQGDLWLLLSSTLCRYNRIKQQLEFPRQWKDLNISNLTSDSEGTIWASTTDGKLLHFDANGTTFGKFDLFGHAGPPVSNRWLESIYITKEGMVVAGTSNTNIKLFDPVKKDYTDISLPATQANLYVRSVRQSENGELWLGTEAGLYIHNRATGITRHVKKDYNDPYALTDNAVYALYEDREGGIWVGTFFGGLNYLPKQYTPFVKFYPKRSANTITGNVVREIRKDNTGHLWIGTEDAGVNKLNPETGQFEHFGSYAGGLSFNNVHGLMVNGNQLWIGTFLHGIDIIDIQRRKVVKHYDVQSGSGFTHDFIYGIYKLIGNKILITTPHGAFGFNESRDQFEWFSGLPRWIWYTVVLQDHKGVIWAGSFGKGVHYYDPATGQTGSFTHNPKDSGSISNDRINGIFEDHLKQLWFTTDDGLCRFNPSTNTFTRFGTEQGFPSDFMFSMLEDGKGRLWISTTRGLACFKPSSGHLQVYTTTNGLLNDQFNYNSAFKDGDGRMYFGSTEGLISFYPDLFTTDSRPAPVSLTAFLINQQEVAPGEGTLLHESITQTDKIELPYNQSTFSIDFASLNFTGAAMLHYAYRMTGLSPNWVQLKNTRRADFVGLPPGSYRFDVKAFRNDGAESVVRSLMVIISPPWWLSTWAYISYTIVTLSIIVILIRIADRRIREKNNRRIEMLKIAGERELLKMELVKEKELLKEKIDFFTNVAHEIKTPLTLIKIPLTKVLKRAEHLPDVKNNLNTMNRNTNRLLELTNQLLDFRQTEINKFKISLKRVNISESLSEASLGFSDVAEEAGLRLLCYLPEQTLYAYVDQDAFSKILYNLLGNAVKYAAREISIYLFIAKKSSGSFTIEVRNDGHIIPSQFKEKIFEPFFRLEEAETETGSGIGLALSRSLTQLHGGQLTLEPAVDHFNIFSLTLPIHYDKDEAADKTKISS